eukprot:gnl/MRDRNA2_/MRDRNA2_120216_c0_seq1.p1 gnl/MRDRNA2_/MRDRNA2_120216_c0~~gnl/MRDRNA2_/MRDRNA2_120216_c0_seq1.p1  ORF type:complete len:513 (-),score=82.84 gnl/MRDRNA2_/MRDRNA2_120216_c0_seq1:109-1449(-)
MTKSVSKPEKIGNLSTNGTGKTKLTHEEWLHVKQKISLDLVKGVENGSLGKSLHNINEAQVRAKVQGQLLSGLQNSSLSASLDALAWKQRVKQRMQAKLAEAVQQVASARSWAPCSSRSASEIKTERKSRRTVVPSISLQGIHRNKCTPRNLSPTMYKRIARSDTTPKQVLQLQSSPQYSPGEAPSGSCRSTVSSTAAESVNGTWPESSTSSRLSESDTSEDDTSTGSHQMTRQSSLISGAPGAEVLPDKAHAKRHGFDLQIHSMIDRLQLQDAGLQDVLVTPRSARDALPSARLSPGNGYEEPHIDALPEVDEDHEESEMSNTDDEESVMPNTDDEDLGSITGKRDGGRAGACLTDNHDSLVSFYPRQSTPRRIELTPRRSIPQVTPRFATVPIPPPSWNSLFTPPALPRCLPPPPPPCTLRPPPSPRDDCEVIAFKSPVMENPR